MMDSVRDWLFENKDMIEKGVEIMGKAAEVLAVTVGQLHPVLEAVFVASAELLSNPDGKEARYLAQQFEIVNQHLEGIQDEIDNIALELQKSSMNKQNFDREAQMLSQYEKFKDFVNAKPELREIKMQKFLSHYENTDSDLNLDSLYNSVTGENTSGDPLLETVVATEKRSRRAVEDFCARLKKLFVVGIIAVMGYAALKEGAVGEDMVKKWQGRMEDVENLMKAAVDDCTENFAEQAKVDMEHQLQKNSGTVDASLTKSLLDSLVKKYDWVNWSIRAFSDIEHICFFKLLLGKNYNCTEGANWFDVLTKNNIKVVVSFCVNPKPINKRQIQEQLEAQKLKGDMMKVALTLHKSFPNCLVHAVDSGKTVVETNNFHDDCYYFGIEKRAYLCIHPE